MIALVVLVVCVATVASAVRLVKDDIITGPWRANLRDKSEQTGKYRFWVDMLECGRCTSVWVSPPITALFGAALLLGYDADWITWFIAAVVWIPVSFGISYLAFLLYSTEELA
jgi:hypothetical protein